MEMAALKTEGDTTVDTNPDERLGLAVLMLAKGTGSIQERLAEAFLQLHALRDKDFSDENLRTDFKQIYDTLTKGGASISSRKLRLNDDEAQEQAVWIVRLFANVMRFRAARV
jgi:hypothetical protein